MLYQKLLEHICLLDEAADVVGQHLDGGGVLAAVGDDDVSVALAGLNESLMHGLDGGEVLVDDAVEGAAALFDVPHQMRTGAGSMCWTSLLRLWSA